LLTHVKNIETKFSAYKESATSVVKEQDDVIGLFTDILGQGTLLVGTLSISERQTIE
jgi:hypothetical protein